MRIHIGPICITAIPMTSQSNRQNKSLLLPCPWCSGAPKTRLHTHWCAHVYLGRLCSASARVVNLHPWWRLDTFILIIFMICCYVWQAKLLRYTTRRNSHQRRSAL